MNEQRVFVGDFETTVYEGQTKTEVWAAACVELYTEDVAIFHNDTYVTDEAEAKQVYGKYKLLSIL